MNFTIILISESQFPISPETRKYLHVNFAILRKGNHKQNARLFKKKIRNNLFILTSLFSYKLIVAFYNNLLSAAM